LSRIVPCLIERKKIKNKGRSRTMELIIDDLLSKVDEGIRRGFLLQGLKKIQRRTKRKTRPQTINLTPRDDRGCTS
jgi:hypothetical protein